jgi:enoyl-CoA hydratase
MAGPLVQAIRGGAILELRLDRPPAHAISRSLLDELRARLDELERDPPGAVVLSATGGRFFSAGLDLVELQDAGRAVLEEFLRDLEDAYLRLFRLPVPVVAAINGHAVAGGALLALTADRRIAARGQHVLGLTEVHAGLPLPSALFELARASIGPRHASEVFLEGRAYPPEEAVAVGLAHELVDAASLAAAAHSAAERLAGIAPAAFCRMKELLHAPAEAAIASKLGDGAFLDAWFSEDCRRARAALLDRLGKRKDAAK